MNLILPTLNSRWKDVANVFTIKQAREDGMKCLDDITGQGWTFEYYTFVKKVINWKLRPL